ncbi:MAG: Gldg family protein [Candidatus Cloacimonetes bacterium]|nr:Gldg family protein [Candidatus Cloacimonadota bacterium]
MKKTDKNSAITSLAIFIAIVIIINIISLRVFFRIDCSKGKIYSLSQASKTAIKNLEDRLTVKAYFTSDLPPDLANVRRYTKDLLDEYKNYSNGKFRFEFIDPKDENKLKEEAQKNGVPPVNVQMRKSDKLEVLQAYLGLVFSYNDKTEAIPLVQESRGLEYEITKAINKIASINLPSIAFYGLTPDIPPNDPRMMWFMQQQQDRYQHAKESIRQNYEMVNTDLNSPIDPSASTLVFSGVVDSLTVEQLYHLDQFIMSGKNVLFFQDRVNADLQTQNAQSINSNIFDFLAHYGVKIQDNLVMDAVNTKVNVQTRQGIFSVNTPMDYPFFPLSNDINKKHPVVSQLGNLQFIFVSEIDTTNIASNVTFTPLIYTSKSTAVTPGPRYNIYVQQFQDKGWMNRLQPIRRTVGGAYEGFYTSFFADKDIPFKGPDFISEGFAKLIVVPDMDFISSQGAGNNPTNMDFLLNAVDYLSNNEALIALRSREAVYKPLNVEKLLKVDELTPEGKEKKIARTQRFIRVTNIILPSILLVLFGLFWYRREIDRRRRIKEIYE